MVATRHSSAEMMNPASSAQSLRTNFIDRCSRNGVWKSDTTHGSYFHAKWANFDNEVKCCFLATRVDKSQHKVPILRILRPIDATLDAALQHRSQAGFANQTGTGAARTHEFASFL